MKILFRQRFLSWFDSYDIYDESDRTIYTVQGKLSWGHRLEIHDAAGGHVGTVQEEAFTLMPRFALYVGKEMIGCIRKEFTFFKPRYTLDCNGWEVDGDFWGWNYQVIDGNGNGIMRASKEHFHMTDVYSIDVPCPEDALLSLMIVLAIDAAKCSSGN